MNKVFAKVVMIAASLVLSASLAFAVDVKTPVPDVSGAAKTTTDKAKASGTATKDKAKTSAADAKAAAKSKIVDINTATEAELKAVPGIGDTYAAKIIAGRPYANKAQLKSRNILPGPVYEKVKDMIVAKQVKK